MRTRGYLLQMHFSFMETLKEKEETNRDNMNSTIHFIVRKAVEALTAVIFRSSFMKRL